MKLPGPDHPITITPSAKRMRVAFNDQVIADSTATMVLKESTYPEVIYFPRDDVEMGFLTKTEHSTHCPYKGDAAYFTLHMDGEVRENMVWTYETPFPAMHEIKDLVAFYPNQVKIYAVDPEV